MATLREDALVLAIQKAAKSYYSENKYPESHGEDHIQAVLKLTLEALATMPCTDREIIFLATAAAAILHEADDRKLAAKVEGAAPGSMPNTCEVLEEARSHLVASGDEIATCDALWGRFKELTLLAISWVSAHANGNNIPDEVRADPKLALLLAVRLADRAEACGLVGAWRCLAYSAERNMPAYTDQTPLPGSEAEIDAAKQNGFDRYCKGKGASPSMLDHYYEKLLHLADTGIDESMLAATPALAYLAEQLTERVEPLKKIVCSPRAELPAILRDLYDGFHNPAEESAVPAYIDSIECGL